MSPFTMALPGRCPVVPDKKPQTPSHDLIYHPLSKMDSMVDTQHISANIAPKRKSNGSETSTLFNNSAVTEPTITTAPQLDDGPLEPPRFPSDHLNRIDTTVRLQDLEESSRPSVYLFIFVNPLSGDRKGRDLINLSIQNFRLRRFPNVQVEMHNILDEKDRELGFDRIRIIEAAVKRGDVPPIREEVPNSPLGRLGKTVRTRHIHVWSAGGDGTVMSVFEMLVAHKVDLDYVYFSCIPFGTGNDFSQVLGWGRTITHSNILGRRLSNLEELVSERLEKAEAARLDIWEIDMTAHPTGFVRVAGPNRNDGHDVQEVKGPQRKGPQRLVRKMCNYMSIGVQGYVGSGFEKHRSGSRLANMLVYTHESAKWVFWRHFPLVTRFIDRMTSNGEVTLVCPEPGKKPMLDSDLTGEGFTDNLLPEMTLHPIDFVIQNIPHIWGREIDLWGDAMCGLESVKHRNGPTDPDKWSQQLANDGKMEVMVIESMYSYVKKLANIRKHVSRIGQFENPFTIHFRPPNTIRESWWKRLHLNQYEKENMVCIMCDGEFYVIKDPKEITFRRCAQIWTLGRSDSKQTGRLVLDELASQRLSQAL
ncbi:ATP-NAD kinase-like domain-containing protein [Phycomyces nitens]|nr:ATP-NAD kinase-like domain-containing protein [Phycomyces nitens]